MNLLMIPSAPPSIEASATAATDTTETSGPDAAGAAPAAASRVDTATLEAARSVSRHYADRRSARQLPVPTPEP